MGVSRDCLIFSVPPIISGMGKATNFQFCTHIHRSEQKPITNFGNNSRLLVRTLEIFQGTHILGASRGLLCDSSAFLLADRTARSMIGSCHHDVVCRSVCPSVTLCIVGLRVGVVVEG